MKNLFPVLFLIIVWLILKNIITNYNILITKNITKFKLLETFVKFLL